MESRKKIQFISLDFDGCLANQSRYLATVKERCISTDGKRKLAPLIADAHLVADTNAPLLQDIKRIQEADGITHSYVLVGSNRQDVPVDANNASHGSGLCFPAISHFATVINANNPQTKTSFLPFLLNDVYNNHRDGESYQQAVAYYNEWNDVENEIQQDLAMRIKLTGFDDAGVKQLRGKSYPISNERYGFDESKLTLLYAQMQHAAEVAGTDCDIVFDFYDDRDDRKSKSDLLTPLHQFFTNNPQLIPSNITLRLHSYDGELHKTYSDVKGTADGYNQDYRETTKRMFAASGYNFELFATNQYEKTPDVLKAFNDNQTMLDLFYAQEDLVRLANHIKTLDMKTNAELIRHLNKLHKHTSKHLNVNDSHFSSVKNVLAETMQMLTLINKPGIDDAEKVAIIKNYQVNCQQLTTLKVVLQTIAVIVACLVGMILGGPILAVVAGVAANNYLFKPSHYLKDVDNVCQVLKPSG